MEVFTNLEINLSELPKFEEVSFKKQERKYLVVKRITMLITVIVLIIAAILAYYFIKKIQNNATLYAIICTITAIALVWFIADSIGFKYAGYALREKDVLSRSGWIFCKTKMIPLSRIQHVSMLSGPIERKFGLACIVLYTAGGDNSDDFSIRGITNETATQLKDWIRSQINNSSATNLLTDGDSEPA